MVRSVQSGVGAVQSEGQSRARVLRTRGRHHRRRDQPDRPGLGQRGQPRPKRCSSPAVPRPDWHDVTCAEFRDEVAALAAGPDRRRGRARRPGGADEQDPVRVDADRLRDLGGRRGHRTDLRDLQRRAGRVDPVRLRRGGARRGDRRRTRAVVDGVRSRLPGAARRLADRRRRGLDKLVGAGSTIDRRPRSSRAATRPAPDDLATIIYTCGYHRAAQGLRADPPQPATPTSPTPCPACGTCSTTGASTLLFLPLAHSFARLIQVGAVHARCRTGHTADVQNLVADLGAFQPTFVLSVPRVFEKVYNTARQRAHADGKGADLRPRRAGRGGLQRGAGHPARPRAGTAPGTHRLFDRLVYGRLRAALGGRCDTRHLRRRAARRAAGALLPGRRGDDLRGVRPDRDLPGGVRSTCDGAIRIGTVGPPAARRVASGSPTTARSSCTATWCSTGTGTTTPATARGARRRRLVPHRRSGRHSTRTGTCRSPGARRRSS